MFPWELFAKIRDASYTTSGDSVDWTVQVNDNEKRVYLLFEESRGKRDWINNLNIFVKIYKHLPKKLYKQQESSIKAARGWGDAWKSCNDEVMEALIKARQEHPDYAVYIAGWSYGGAMTVLAAEDYHYRTGEKPFIVTFGAPKPLFSGPCQEYVRSCIAAAWQWSNNNDCVCAMPPFPGYHRINTMECGDRFNLIKWFKPGIYHCMYGDKEIYPGTENI